MNKNNRITPTELLLKIDSFNKRLYYRVKEGNFSFAMWDNDPKELEQFIKTGKSSPIPDDIEAYCLPSFTEIDHKGIMSFFVKECIEDPGKRKEYFSILRRKEGYVKLFVQKMKDDDEYQNFLGCVSSLYDQIFNEWVEKNKLEKYFFKK